MEVGKCPDVYLKISSDFTLTNVGTVLEQWSVAWQTSCLAASRKLRGLIITKPLNFNLKIVLLSGFQSRQMIY